MSICQRMQYHPRCTKIYSSRKFANAKGRNIYEYETFCNYRTCVKHHCALSWRGGGVCYNIRFFFLAILSTKRSNKLFFKGEVRREMNFTYVLGFVVLKDVVKVFPVSSSSFARKATGRNGARSHSGAWRGLKTKWDLKLSLPSPTYLIRYLFI